MYWILSDALIPFVVSQSTNVRHQFCKLRELLSTKLVILPEKGQFGQKHVVLSLLGTSQFSRIGIIIVPLADLTNPPASSVKF